MVTMRSLERHWYSVLYADFLLRNQRDGHAVFLLQRRGRVGELERKWDRARQREHGRGRW